jgi:hypothetical protein
MNDFSNAQLCGSRWIDTAYPFNRSRCSNFSSNPVPLVRNNNGGRSWTCIRVLGKCLYFCPILVKVWTCEIFFSKICNMQVHGNVPDGNGSDTYGWGDWTDESNIRLLHLVYKIARRRKNCANLTYRYFTLILLHSLTCAGISVRLGSVSYFVGCGTRTEMSHSSCMRYPGAGNAWEVC